MTDWNLFLVLDAEPVEVSGGRDSVVLLADRRMLALPDNGFQLLLAWVAGPRRVVRTPAPVHPDQEIIDAFVNSYLVDSGVPPRPRGFAWYLDLPSEVEPADVWRAVNSRTVAVHGEAVDLRRVRAAMASVIVDLYA